LPGEFRSSQNWIGGASPADAAFVPPAHIYIDELMADMEKFLHNDQIHVPELIRIGIAHYQFETIHPFLDGNGRIGRLLITLYLIHAGILAKPLLYLSAFFEQDRDLYYDNLTRVRQKNDLLHWLRYFLVGIEQTARVSVETLNKIIQLKGEVENTLREKAGRRLANSLKLLEFLFVSPIVNIADVKETSGITTKAAGDLVAFFVELNLLKEYGSMRRNRLFAFHPYLDLFEKTDGGY
jgi:Fic family protein